MAGEGKSKLLPWKQAMPPVVALSDANTPDPNDFDEIEKALNSTSGRVRGLWISYLLLSTYLLISVGSVTHRMLFLETPIKLPVLNVDLPLNGFFFVAPLLYFIVHFYLLLQMALLSARARDYNSAIAKYNYADEDENRIRQRIDTFVILQFIAGPNRENFRHLNAALALIAWLTMTMLPVLLFLFMQLQYLPYHHPWITWLHRAVVIADLAALWAFWGGISRGKAIWPGWEKPGLFINVSATLAVSAFALIFAVYPGEYVHDKMGRNPVTQFFFEGNINDVKGGTAGWFANRIIVPDQDFVDDSVLAEIRDQESLEAYIAAGSPIGDDGKPKPVSTSLKPGEFKLINSFRGRDLRGAVLDRTDLRRTDFTAVDMQGASLQAAKLDRSVFGCASLQRNADKRGREGLRVPKKLKCADVSESNLEDARLFEISAAGVLGNRASTPIWRVNFKNVFANQADLRAANLTYADFSFSNLSFSKFQRAELKGARLRRSVMRKSSLQGALLTNVDFLGAVLDSSNFVGASIDRSVFIGASLRAVILAGARLDSSDLRAVQFNRAFLRGSTLTRARIIGSSLEKAVLPLALPSSIINWNHTILTPYSNNDISIYSKTQLVNRKISKIKSISLINVSDKQLIGRISAIFDLIEVEGVRKKISANAAWIRKLVSYYDFESHIDFLVQLSCTNGEKYPHRDTENDGALIPPILVQSDRRKLVRYGKLMTDKIASGECVGAENLNPRTLERLKRWGKGDSR